MTSVSSVPPEDDSSNINDEPIKTKLLRKLSGIFNEVMKDRSIKYYVGVILIPLNFLQMIAYIYDQNIAFPFHDTFYATASNLLNYIRVIPALEKAHNATIYWLLMYLLVAMIITFFLLMVYVDYSNKIGKFLVTFPLKTLMALCIIFYWVLLTPTVEGFTGIYLCSGGQHLIVSSMKCWQLEHAIYCTIFTLALLVFILLILIIATFNNESNTTSRDIFRRADCNMELYFAAYRIVIGIVSPFCRTSNLQWFLIIIYLAGAIAFVRNYYLYLPYYDRRMSELYGASMLSYFWVCFNLFLLKIFEKANYNGKTIVIVVGIVILYFLLIKIRNAKVIDKIFNGGHNKISYEYEFCVYINKLGEMIESTQLSELEDVILLGFITNHKSECSNPECPLNSSSKLYLPILNKSVAADIADIKDPIMLAHLLNSIYSEYSLINSTATLHLLYSYFLFYKMGNVHCALLELGLASRCDNSIQQSFSIYRMKNIIKLHLSSQSKGKINDKEIRNLDVNIVIVFEGMLLDLRKLIEKSSNQHIEFWAHLNTLLPDLNQLHKLGLSIIQYSRQTRDVWNKLCKINPSYPLALRIYGLYLRDIKNEEDVGTKLIEKEKNIKVACSSSDKLNNFDMMFAETTAIIVISGAKETQGKITKTNSGILKIFGYNSKEIIGHDASIIMPSIIGKEHDKFLNRYFTTGKEKILNREKMTFAMHRGRYVMPVCIIVKPISIMEDDINYIALIRSVNKNIDYIITDTDGKIDSMTEKIKGIFGITSNSFFKDKDVFIHIIFPDLMTNVKLADDTVSSRFDLLESGDSINIPMVVSRDFKREVQALNNYGKEIKLLPTEIACGEHPKENKNKKTLSYRRFEESIKFNSKEFNSVNPLKSCIEYNNPEYYEKVKVQLIEEQYGDGILKIKIFKITHENKDEQESSHRSKEVSLDYNSSPNDTLQNNLPTNELFFDRQHEVSLSKNNYMDFTGPNQDRSNLKLKKVNEQQTTEEKIEFNQSPIEGNQNEETNNIIYSSNTEEPLQEVDKIFLNANKRKAMFKKAINIMGKVKKIGEDKAKPINNDNNGSMISTSTTKSMQKKIKKMRMAMYEKYEPRSVRQLKITSQIVFLILIALTISIFFIQKQLIVSCQANINNLYDSRDRILSLTAIAYSTRMLSYQHNIECGEELRNSNGFGNIYYNNSQLPYFKWTILNIERYASILKEAQNKLSTTSSIINSKYASLINPSDVNIYFPEADQTELKIVSIDCWSSLMSLVTHAHNVAALEDGDLNNPSDYPESVEYITENAMDSILLSINLSTDAILNKIKSSLTFNEIILKVLLSIASALLIISMIILFPVAFRVAKNKGKLLSLFIDIRSEQVKEQLIKCRKCFNLLRVDNDRSQGDELDDEEEDNEEKKNESDSLIDENKYKSKRNKNYKKYNTHFCSTVVRFLLFVTFLESYFIFAFFYSNDFFIKTHHISNEVAIIAQSTYSNALLYRAEIEMIGNKSSTRILGMQSQMFVENFTEHLKLQQEKLLNIHSENMKYNNKFYDKQFDQIVFNSICEAIYNQSEECNELMGGILKKGLHSANMAFWDNMREIANSYIADELNSSLGTQQIIENEFLETKYLSESYEAIQSMLNTSIQSSISKQKYVEQIVFLAYFFVMILVYYIFWRLFLESTRTSLWVTKSMLSIIPIEVVDHVKSITAFLNHTSLSSLE